MPLRQDKTLWWNMPGIVAAYQPVRGPNLLLARCNMARGGDNRFGATDGVAPMWSPVSGWTFDGATQYLETSIVPDDPFSVFVRVKNTLNTGVVIGGREGGSDTSNGIYLQPGLFTGPLRNLAFCNGATVTYVETPGLVNGTMGVAAKAYYRDGVYRGTLGVGVVTTTRTMNLARINQPTPGAYWSGNMLTVVVCERTLAQAEVYSVSQQMAYADVNPEWSVWGRRRQWYYGSTAGFLAAWAARNNSVIKQVGQ